MDWKRILAESTMARRPAAEARHEIIRGVEDKALRWLRTFIPFARKSLAASTRKAERGAFATINMNYVYWLRVYVTVREPVIQQAKQSLILIPCMNVLTQ
jgi:hypothetical protein